MNEQITRLIAALEGDYITLADLINQLRHIDNDLASAVEEDPMYWKNSRIISKLRGNTK